MKIYYFLLFLTALIVSCADESSVEDANCSDCVYFDGNLDITHQMDVQSSDSGSRDISFDSYDASIDIKDIESDTDNIEDVSLSDSCEDTQSQEDVWEDILDMDGDAGYEDISQNKVFRLDSPVDGEHYKRLTPVVFKGYTPKPFVVLAEGYYKFAEWNKSGDFEFSYAFSGTGNREISFVIEERAVLIIHLLIEEDKTFDKYILETIELLIREDSNLGYGDGQHTRSLYYNGDQIFAVKDRTSHCVGITMQTLVMAMNKYYEDTKDASVWNMPSSWLKWEPFKYCWYVDSAIKCYGARDALVKYGIGEKVEDFSKLRPADFVNYDRTSGTGHSVIFLNYLYDDGNSGTEYKSNAIGFKYFSSQGSTNGAGYKNAFFDGFCSDKFTNKDCGIIKSSLVMGRVWEPRDFIPQKQGVSPVLQNDYDGSGFVNLEYFNDISRLLNK